MTSHLSSAVGGRSSHSEAMIAAPCVDSPESMHCQFSSSISPIQNPGPGRMRMKPVKTGSPQYRA